MSEFQLKCTTFNIYIELLKSTKIVQAIWNRTHQIKKSISIIIVFVFNITTIDKKMNFHCMNIHSHGHLSENLQKSIDKKMTMNKHIVSTRYTPTQKH